MDAWFFPPVVVIRRHSETGAATAGRREWQAPDTGENLDSRTSAGKSPFLIGPISDSFAAHDRWSGDERMVASRPCVIATIMAAAFSITHQSTPAGAVNYTAVNVTEAFSPMLPSSWARLSKAISPLSEVAISFEIASPNPVPGVEKLVEKGSKTLFS